MKHLLIIGARGYGREVYNLFLECSNSLEDTCCKGFLDDKNDALLGFPNYPPIISSVEDYEVETDDVFICALGDVSYKKKYAEIILNKGGKFINLIHPTAHIGINTKLGVGCIVGYNANISCDITIDDFVTIQPFAALGHDVKVGKWCHLNAFCFLGGKVEVGEQSTIHTGAIIVPSKKVANNSIVGAGAVVIRNVKSGKTVFGNPAECIEF